MSDSTESIEGPADTAADTSDGEPAADPAAESAAESAAQSAAQSADGATDGATDDATDALDLDTIERDLDDVQAALVRLDAGTYWVDEVTGEPIADDVLVAHPTARTAAAPVPTTATTAGDTTSTAHV